MTKCVHQVSAVLLLTAAMLLLRPGSLLSRAPEKTKAPTAVEIAKEWRYPGAAVDKSVTSSKSENFYIESYSVEADFADVWNHFAAKSGSEEKFKDNKVWLVMGELKGPDKGHYLVFGDGREADFGQNTESRTVHVEIRKAGGGRVNVLLVAGVR